MRYPDPAVFGHDPWWLMLAVASAWAISFAFSDLFRIPMP